jgi:gamma-glutamyl-gamma-aminobutyraldehyde dehydrogenase
MTPKDPSDWTSLVSELVMPSVAIIDGVETDASSGQRIDCVNPATGAVIADVPACGDADVDAAVSSARRCFARGEWPHAAPAERSQALHRLADLMELNSVELALLETLDVGKPIADSCTVDVPGAIKVLRWYADLCEKVYGEVAPSRSHQLGTVTREPVGVVAAIVPWNYPLQLAIWKVAPALVAGNTVVLKPSEDSPLSAIRLGQLAMEAGIPCGALNVVPGVGSVAGRALGLHPDVDCVAFTGATETGKRFLRYASETTLRPVWLECGGKSPVIVFDDVRDLDETARAVGKAIFSNAGQMCSAHSRLIVHTAVKDQLLQRLSDIAMQIRVGDPLDESTEMGPLASQRHADAVIGYMDSAKQSARLVCGGSRIGSLGPTFVQPTIFDQVATDAAIAREEIFGPLLSVFEFESEDEALQIAHDTGYGLAASIWTENFRRAHRVGTLLRAGTVSVNRVDALEPTTPFGGVGQSGYGRDMSAHALDKFTSLKTTWYEYGSD